MLPEDSDRGYGLDAGKLYAVIGKLVLENRIRLSVNPFFKDIEKLQSVAFFTPCGGNYSTDVTLQEVSGCVNILRLLKILIIC